VVDELLPVDDASAGADGAMEGAVSGGIQIFSPILDAPSDRLQISATMLGRMKHGYRGSLIRAHSIMKHL
jgi:hypothetical protein